MDRRPIRFPAAVARQNGNRGFSIVEDLIVVAVIGIITAIASPTIGNINATAGVATAQSNAQNIVSVFSAGISAGAPSFISCTTVRQAQDAVGAGDHGAGSMSTTLFQVSGITESSDDAKPVEQRSGYYLTWGSNGILIYDESGGHFN